MKLMKDNKTLSMNMKMNLQFMQKAINGKIINTHSFYFTSNQMNEFSSSDEFDNELNHNLKVKLNKLFKKVHPDVLRGNKVFSDHHINENEKSVQELNRYYNCLKEGDTFESKIINFNCIDSLIKTNFIKYSLHLPKINKNENIAKKKAILSNKINQILNNINQYDENAVKLENYEHNNSKYENTNSDTNNKKDPDKKENSKSMQSNNVNSNPKMTNKNEKSEYLNFEARRQYEQSKLLAEKINKNTTRPIKKEEYL